MNIQVKERGVYWVHLKGDSEHHLSKVIVDRVGDRVTELTLLNHNKKYGDQVSVSITKRNEDIEYIDKTEQNFSIPEKSSWGWV